MVNFYFEINREQTGCKECNGTGLNPETKAIDDDWYDFEDTGREWMYKLTQHEVDALWNRNRLHHFKEKPTFEKVNSWARKGIGHDAINKWICVKARAEKEGIYGKCHRCQGQGFLFTEPKCRLSLQLWYLHPRKGCSRGVFIKEIKESELPKVINYLKEARNRNHERFSKL